MFACLACALRSPTEPAAPGSAVSSADSASGAPQQPRFRDAENAVTNDAAARSPNAEADAEAVAEAVAPGEQTEVIDFSGTDDAAQIDAPADRIVAPPERPTLPSMMDDIKMGPS